jgi:hypothetical protein
MKKMTTMTKMQSTGNAMQRSLPLLQPQAMQPTRKLHTKQWLHEKRMHRAMRLPT